MQFGWRSERQGSRLRWPQSAAFGALLAPLATSIQARGNSDGKEEETVKVKLEICRFGDLEICDLAIWRI